MRESLNQRLPSQPSALLLFAALASFGACNSSCPPGWITSGTLCHKMTIDGGAEVNGASQISDADRRLGSAAPSAGSAGTIDNVAGAANGGSAAMGNVANAGTAAIANVGTDEACPEEGQIRCALAGAGQRDAGQREQCVGGRWSVATACAAGQICDASGGCIALADLCRGNGGQAICDGNTLVCNADGANTATVDCTPGFCDADGAECDKCQPGQKTCQDGAVLTCDADGQNETSSACPDNGKCVDAGRCAACSVDGDCTSLTNACLVGYCSRDGTCGTKDAVNRSVCIGAGGVCLDGLCVGCLSDTDCSKKPQTPICNTLLHSCRECYKMPAASEAMGCSAAQSCSTVGTCVPKCGNGVIDAGEECEPPGTSICSPSCLKIP
jgi:hypothetical protein